MGRGLNGRSYFLDERELHRANPDMHFPLPRVVIHFLEYLRVVLLYMDTFL
jgi:hypothetical protein